MPVRDLTSGASLTQKCQYMASALELLRARLSEIRTPESRSDVLNFAGRKRHLITKLNGHWDELTDRSGVPAPDELMAWL